MLICIRDLQTPILEYYLFSCSLLLWNEVFSANQNRRFTKTKAFAFFLIVVNDTCEICFEYI